MHLVRYHVAVSLDGFIAPPDGGAEWLEPYGNVAMGFIGPWMKQIGGVIVGRATYDQALDMGGWMYGKTPTLVLTSRPVEQGPQTVHAHAGDPAEGLAKLRAAHPDVQIWTAAIDSHLNDHGYIVPGLGDAGDRMYGTK